MTKIRYLIGRIITDPRGQFITVLVVLALTRSHAQAVQDSIAAGGLVQLLSAPKRP